MTPLEIVAGVVAGVACLTLIGEFIRAHHARLFWASVDRGVLAHLRAARWYVLGSEDNRSPREPRVITPEFGDLP